ncbi:MAG: hypothetical protein JJT81_15820 [Rubellimicrobium sp.]|nr:hypothetical protein [Rubellimicrobium sp.]
MRARIDGTVAKLHDVEVIPGVASPMALAPSSPELLRFVTHSNLPDR